MRANNDPNVWEGVVDGESTFLWCNYRWPNCPNLTLQILGAYRNKVEGMDTCGYKTLVGGTLLASDGEISRGRLELDMIDELFNSEA